MVTVDLVTGFLGAGKTTFIHKYLHYLKDKGLHVQIIENEFGDVSIDKEFLSDEDCEINDLSGLCMCCVGKEAFIRMLLESAASGCDRIIVEPSGIYDVDEFFEVLSLPKISECCEIGSIITIADPTEIMHMTEESKYLTFGQFLASGIIVVSKTQLLSEQELKSALDCMNELMREKGCEAGLLSEVITKPFDELNESDFEDIEDAGYNRIIHDREMFSHSEIFQSFEFLVKATDERSLETKIRRVFENSSCGVVFRVKGYARDDSGNRYEVNCTKSVFSIRRAESLSDTIVVIGQHLKRREIKQILTEAI